ncbi:hypothetical protein LSAT2_012066, partial [Lamellibrachia satsuma]
MSQLFGRNSDDLLRHLPRRCTRGAACSPFHPGFQGPSYPDYVGGERLRHDTRRPPARTGRCLATKW